MAHLVETMAYQGQVPWHGLGFQIEQDASIEQWQQAAGLDWSVSKRPVQYSAPGANLGPQTKPFKDKFVLARDSDDRPYSVVSGRYKPVQPAQILEFFRDLVGQQGMQIETAGSLKDGAKIWALAKTGDVHKVMGVDEVKSYMVLTTSYDLTLSTLAYFTSVRVVCNNTLQQSFGDMSNRICIPHFRDFDAEDVKQKMGLGREQWDSFAASLDVLAKVKLDEVKAQTVLNNVFQIKPESIGIDGLQSNEKAQVSNVFQLFMGKGIGSDIAGQTAWGLLNGVTEFADKHKRARGQGNRLDSAWFGEGAQLKQRAYDELIQLAA